MVRKHAIYALTICTSLVLAGVLAGCGGGGGGGPSVPSEKIAFMSDRDGNTEIYVMNSDGTAQTRLTNNPSTDYLPAFSPDGSKIAFASQRDDNREIYVMNSDGSGQTNITNSAASDEDPSFGVVGP